MAFILPRGAQTIPLKSELGIFLKDRAHYRMVEGEEIQVLPPAPEVHPLPFLPVTCYMELSKFLHLFDLQNGNSALSRSRPDWCSLGN